MNLASLQVFNLQQVYKYRLEKNSYVYFSILRERTNLEPFKRFLGKNSWYSIIENWTKYAERYFWLKDKNHGVEKDIN